MEKAAWYEGKINCSYNYDKENSAMNQPAVICDDLTGAMEAGLQLYKAGLETYIIIHDRFVEQIKNKEAAIVFDTESRNIVREKAAEKIKYALKTINDANFSVIYKKVDSTLRGNLGTELEAALQNSQFDMAVLSPALPYNGRTTKNGCHYLSGIELSKSDLARDPFSPVLHSYIPDILKLQTAIPAETIKLIEVRQGAAWLCEKFKELRSNGFKIVVADAETDQDMEIIAEALKDSGLNLLPCGSAGLLSRLVLNKCRQFKAKPTNKPVFVISGSPAENNKSQIKKAKASGYSIVEFDLNTAKSNADITETICKISDKVIELLTQGKSTVVDAAGNGKSHIADQYKDNHSALISDSKLLQNIIAGIFKRITDKVELAGAMIIGGDTLNNICRKMDVSAIKISGEVEPFIPSGELILADGRKIPIVSKAGGFGNENTIVNSIRYMKGE